jgi:hypothetical protein
MYDARAPESASIGRETDADSNARERWLKLLLRAFGTICLVALVPLFMPASWIHVAHEWLGWGPFPAPPIAEYMARSNSALSAFYGGLLVALSLDVNRYRPIIRYQALAIMAYSTAGLILGRAAGMPWWFVLGDFLGCWLFCGPIWLLAGKLPVGAQAA